MSVPHAILMTPLLDSQGVWGGVWIRGENDDAAGLRDRLVECMPKIHVVLEAGLPLAADIQNAQQLEQAKSKGATWFCGPQLSHPQPVAGNTQDAGRANLLRLMSLVAQDADTDDIEAVFKRDPGLSFHLLRLVNSPGIGLSRKISSFNDAIMVLGRRQLQRWVQLLLYASKKQDKPSALLAFAAMRGRTMEKLAAARGRDGVICEQAFMTGIFSLLDSLLGMAMPEIIQAVRLPEPVQRALQDHQGELGELLGWVEEVQAGCRLDLPGGIDTAQYVDIQIEAMQWAQHIGAEIG